MKLNKTDKLVISTLESGELTLQEIADKTAKASQIDRTIIPPNKDAEAYAIYFYQLEKVNLIEKELERRKLDPEKIYNEK